MLNLFSNVQNDVQSTTPTLSAILITIEESSLTADEDLLMLPLS